MQISPSLFDAPANPVLSMSAQWLSGLMTGTFAISLGVIAVALVGLMLMTGRLAIRDGIRVVLGCFLLFAAPMIAASLRAGADGVATPFPPPMSIFQKPAPTPLPPANYDPYAGASLRPQ